MPVVLHFHTKCNKGMCYFIRETLPYIAVQAFANTYKILPACSQVKDKGKKEARKPLENAGKQTCHNNYINYANGRREQTKSH